MFQRVLKVLLSLRMRNIGQLFFFVLALLCVCVSQISAQTISHIADKAPLLKEAEKRQLNQTLQQYYDRHGLPMYLYTVSSLNGEDLDQAALKAFEELEAKEHPLSNAAMIFVARKERKLKVLTDNGLAWQINEATGQFITKQVLYSFRKGAFLEGLKKGFEKIKEKGTENSWNVFYPSFQNFESDKANSKGRIVKLEGTPLTKEYVESKLRSSLSTYVKTPQNELIQINFKIQQLDDIKSLIHNVGGVIHARVVSTNPLDMNLIAVE